MTAQSYDEVRLSRKTYEAIWDVIGTLIQEREMMSARCDMLYKANESLSKEVEHLQKEVRT